MLQARKAASSTEDQPIEGVLLSVLDLSTTEGNTTKMSVTTAEEGENQHYQSVAGSSQSENA